MKISELGTQQVKLMEKGVCLNDLLLEQFCLFDLKVKENKIPLYFNKALKDIDSYVFIDACKLNKILSNLIENALKYTFRGFVEFGYEIKNEILDIYVKDTGLGTSEQTDGLGLSLSIAKEDAQLMGGDITLISKIGEGSVFHLCLPYQPVISTGSRERALFDENIDESLNVTVLIVEDDEINHLYLEVILEDNKEYNFQLIHAKHGLEAIEFCKDNIDIKLVLMDLKMPIMNGFDASQKIKEFLPALPIIAQTTYSTEQDKRKAFSFGCDDFISKPFTEDDLIKMIKNYI